MAKKKTFTEIKDYIEQQGYFLLSKDYKNSGSKLCIGCPKGHKYRGSWDKFRDGHRCPNCVGKGVTLEVVRKFINDQGYRVLSTHYRNNHTKLLVECPEEHRYRVTYNNFKQGRRCPICHRNNIPSRSIKRANAYSVVKTFIENHGYTLLSKIYKNTGSKLKVQCPTGYQYEVTFSNFKTGYRCPHCAGKVVTLGSIRQAISITGYKLLSNKYKNCYTRLQIECPKGHQYKTTWSNFQQGHRCPKCTHQQSKGELEIVNYLRSKGVYVIERDRKTLGGKELDIFIPSREWVEK